MPRAGGALQGRLQENASAFFARAASSTAGRRRRDYRGKLVGVPGVEVRYLSASEIASQLASGAAHLGVTGEDLIRETLPDVRGQVELLTPLGFGNATVVVAVPQAWIDVRVMADLDEVAATMRARHGRRLRVATKYVNLTPPLLRRDRRRRLPHRGEPRRHRRRTGGGLGRDRRGHHPPARRSAPTP